MEMKNFEYETCFWKVRVELKEECKTYAIAVDHMISALRETRKALEKHYRETTKHKKELYGQADGAGEPTVHETSVPSAGTKA